MIGRAWAGPVAIRTAKRFPLLKGGMHYWCHHCHARGERGTGKTGNRAPSKTSSVLVPMQQSAVQPILSPISFRYALIQPCKDKRIHQMLRADYSESISQAVSGIRDTPSLEGRSKAAIAQAVVLRLLAAAGWDVFDLSQVMPGYITGNRSIDFALMPVARPAQRSSPAQGVH